MLILSNMIDIHFSAIALMLILRHVMSKGKQKANAGTRKHLRVKKIVIVSVSLKTESRSLQYQ